MEKEKASFSSMRHVVSILHEISQLGIFFYVGGCEDLTIEVIAKAVMYQRKTGGNAVSELHLIRLAEEDIRDDGGYGCRIDGASMMKDDMKTKSAERVLSSQFWRTSDEVKFKIESWLAEAEMRKSYAYRREEANLYIFNRNVRKRIFKRDGNRCLYCGSTDNLSIDHVVAVVNGGGNEDENLQTLCKKCNSSKGGKR
jgi:hypothetical protein